MDLSKQSTVGLTLREEQVILLVREGKTNKQIARALSVAERTVRFHLRNVFKKLDAANRAHAVSKAIQIGLIS